MRPARALRASLTTLLSAALALAPGYAAAQVEPPDASSVMRINGGGGARSASLVLPLGKSAIIDLLTAAVKSAAPEAATTVITLERPKQAQHGDFSCNVAMQLAKVLRAVGWEVHRTFYVPSSTLGVLVVASLVLLAIAWLARGRGAS